MKINDIEAFVTTGGVPHEELLYRDGSDEKTKVAFIESQAGQSFGITIADTLPHAYRHKGIWAKIFADGKLLRSVGMLHGETLRVSTAKDRNGDRRLLTFTEPRFIDGAVEPEDVLNKIGLLEIIVYIVIKKTSTSKKETQTSGPATDTASIVFSGSEAPALTRHSNKQGHHVVGLGDRVIQCPASSCASAGSDEDILHVHKDKLDDESYLRHGTSYLSQEVSPDEYHARFKFFHKSRDQLVSDGIVSSNAIQLSKSRDMTKAIKAEQLDEDVHMTTAGSSSPSGARGALTDLPAPTAHAATASSTPLPTHSVATEMARISDLLAEAQRIRASFPKILPPQVTLLPSGEPDPDLPQHHELLRVREYLRAVMTGINASNALVYDQDDTLRNHRNTSIRTVDEILDILRRWIDTTANPSKPTTNDNEPPSNASGAWRTSSKRSCDEMMGLYRDVHTLNNANPSNTQPLPAHEGGGAIEAEPAVGPPNDQVQPKQEDEENGAVIANGVQPMQEDGAAVEFDVKPDVKPNIKPDPDAPARVNRGPSLKMQILQARKELCKAVTEERRADLEYLVGEQAEQAKRRKIGIRNAIDLTQD
ncbi:unnamed protein product [Peniophora sp. CBMAI 1063]|nr:unnamed protein product [Peniophora sp. CBMAI 1063]